MMNLPKSLPFSERTMYVGIGGGYDIFGSIPIFESREDDNAVFVSVSNEFTSIPGYGPHEALDPNMGAKPLAKALEDIRVKNMLGSVIAVDGGVDCLMHGDEDGAGTVLRDFVTLAALDILSESCPKVTVACVGLGCEFEENMNTHAVIQNISQLIQDGSFYGSCSLTNKGDAFERYKTACESAVRRSHIQTRVIASAQGVFGPAELKVDANLSSLINSLDNRGDCLINPFMSIYWFFTLQGIVRRNRQIPYLRETNTMREAIQVYRRDVVRSRPIKKFVLE